MTRDQKKELRSVVSRIRKNKRHVAMMPYARIEQCLNSMKGRLHPDVWSVLEGLSPLDPLMADHLVREDARLETVSCEED